MTWIVVANSNLCRIYSVSKNTGELSVVTEMAHPESKLKRSDYLTSDRPGRYQTDYSTGGSYSQPTDPKEVEIDNFSREIAQELNKGRNDHAYTHLIIITDPHMNGLLTKHLDKHVKELIKKEIKKDVVQLPNHELLNFIKESLKLS